MCFISSDISFFVFLCGLFMLIPRSSAICCVFFIYELFRLFIVLLMYAGLHFFRFIAYMVRFVSILCSMSSILSSSYMNSLGVVCGILRMRFITLLRIVFSLFICVLFISQRTAFAKSAISRTLMSLWP